MTYDEMIDIINACKRQRKLEKRLYNIPEKEWIISDDTVPDFVNYEYRLYDETPRPAIVGLFFDGNHYYPKLVNVEYYGDKPNNNIKALFDNMVKETVKNDPKFRRWLTDTFYYNT